MQHLARMGPEAHHRGNRLGLESRPGVLMGAAQGAITPVRIRPAGRRGRPWLGGDDSGDHTAMTAMQTIETAQRDRGGAQGIAGIVKRNQRRGPRRSDPPMASLGAIRSHGGPPPPRWLIVWICN